MASVDSFISSLPYSCFRRGHAETYLVSSRGVQQRRVGTVRHRIGRAGHLANLWREDFPRILDDIPKRRLPQVDFPTVVDGFGRELKSLLFPTSLSPQEVFNWRVLITISLVVALLLELTAVATRTARGLADVREARQIARKAKSGAQAQSKDEPNLEPAPDIPRTQQALRQLQADRKLYKKEIREERTRGLAWLALVTAVAIWCTGILNKDNALQP